MYILFKILHSLSFSAGLYDCHLMIQKALTRLMTEPFMNPPSIYSPLWESQLSIGTRQYTFVQGCVSSHCVHNGFRIGGVENSWMLKAKMHFNSQFALTLSFSVDFSPEEEEDDLTLSGHGLQTPVSLEVLIISECPDLEAIPSLENLTSLTELQIVDCGRLTSIPSGLASCISLTSLYVDGCHNLISLADHNLSSLQSLSSLSVSNCRKLQYLPKGLHSLSGLKSLWIGKFCKQLDSFPDLQVPSEKLILYGWPKLKSLPQPIQHSTCLTSLSIYKFHGVEALPEWLGNLTSLTKLEISYCKNLMFLPAVEAMQRLTKLHKLEIRWCPRLQERCARDGPE
ncbi:hypothetical protein DVH24_018057 [Malus domestica]|uniref:R13L1/DRL21-like LRR repeat region domain-containing protein n=1 Tax=Malus domestica TaxID=3750 RepID=A0A498KJS0_MALDO|nr:hypothetical protein DVH24_018057 [Malus domestica]